ncbi:hypothetical protein [Streptomyces profundus]|uniref:hypothetical protein n=1 Tax=Streptomyces profundus TaxID=2867410 RepID=UPI001D15F6B6|nr:hypothetical protein [Streptomyces sp. MA3_2.13]UED84098.1 hypothetical protein K4G22_07660 [Streptomyces sp. MA3_2.13]
MLVSLAPPLVLAWAQHGLRADGQLMRLSLFGLDLGPFTVIESGAPEHWLPRLVFLVVFGALAYGVLRSSPRPGPTGRGLLLTLAAALFAGAVADLLSDLLWLADLSGGVDADLVASALAVGASEAAGASFSVLAALLLVVFWLEWRLFVAWLWLLRRWTRPPRRSFGFLCRAMHRVAFGRAPRAGAPRGRARRDAALAALCPVLLLAVAGGRAMEHGVVEPYRRDELFVDPEVYAPPPPSLVERWSGALYPALRLRPLEREPVAAWLATLAVAVALLVVLGWLLDRLRWAPGPAGPVALVALGWAATLLAGAAAAVLERWLFADIATEVSPELFFVQPLLEATRFGVLWGWLPGVALLWWERARHGRPGAGAPRPAEGAMAHAG